jgi:hypothetical protein
MNVLTYLSSKRDLEYHMNRGFSLEINVLNSRITAILENIFVSFLNEKLMMKIIVFLAPAQNMQVFVSVFC